MNRTGWAGFGDASFAQTINDDGASLVGSTPDLSILTAPISPPINLPLPTSAFLTVQPNAPSWVQQLNIPAGMGLPLAIAGVGLLALLFIPTASPGPGRRR
jgi:hypothetical protein